MIYYNLSETDKDTISAMEEFSSSFRSNLLNFTAAMDSLEVKGGLDEGTRHRLFADHLQSEIERFSGISQKLSERANKAGDTTAGNAWRDASSTAQRFADQRQGTSDKIWASETASSLSETVRKHIKPLANASDFMDAWDMSGAISKGNWGELGAKSSAVLGGIAGGLAVRAVALTLNPFFGAAAIVLTGFFTGALAEFIWNSLDSIAERVRDAFRQAFGQQSPIALDLNGDGIGTSPASGSVLFDHDGDGTKHGSGWVNSEDGLLAMDRNGNGRIDSGRELFGTNTELADGSLARDGYEALSGLDDNGDGVINAQDAVFDELLVWQDRNQDGVSQADELVSLEDAGIGDIGTGATRGETDLANGNSIIAEGSFTWADGSKGVSIDFNFAEDKFYREFSDNVDIPDELKDLPNMRGSGAVRNLRQAAALDGDLADALRAYSEAGTRSEQVLLLDGLIDAWAASSSFRTFIQRIEDQSGDGRDIQLRIPDGPDLEVGRFEGTQVLDTMAKIKVLEVFNNQEFFRFNFEEGPDGLLRAEVTSGLSGSTRNGTTAGTITLTPEDFALEGRTKFHQRIDEAYDALRFSVYSALVTQTRFKPYLDAVALTAAEDGSLSLDFSELTARWEETLASGNHEAIVDFVEFYGNVGGDLSTAGWQWGNNRISQVVTGSSGQVDLEALQRELGKVGNDAFVLDGGDGADRLYGRDGNDILFGGNDSSKDRLYGNGGDDLLLSGGGEDLLEGGSGNDTYRYNSGSGWNHVEQDSSGEGDTDTLEFGEGIIRDQITTFKSGDDLKVDVGGEGFIINDWFDGASYQLDQFRLDDGTTYTAAEFLKEIRQQGSSSDDILSGHEGTDIIDGGGGDDRLYGRGGNDILFGGDGADQLYGHDGNDTLFSGGGGDLLEGGSGNDTYRYNSGSGWNHVEQDSSDEGDTDTIEFGEGIIRDQITTFKSGDDLKMDVGGEGFVINDWFDGAKYQLEQFRLDDGTTYTAAEFLKEIRQQGSSSDDTLYGHEGTDIMDGGNGADRLRGRDGNDILFGGKDASADYLYGEKGADTLVAGENDYLYGGSGDDTYRFEYDGNWNNSTIKAESRYAKSNETAVFEGYSPEELWFQRDGDNLLVSVIGQDNRTHFEGWYDDTDNQMGAISTGDEKLLASQVDQLVSVMASFVPPTGADAVMPADAEELLRPQIAASWQPVA